MEIQYFDGNIDEFELTTWYTLEIEPIETPEDWTGPLNNIEKDDLTPIGTEMQHEDWDAHMMKKWKKLQRVHVFQNRRNRRKYEASVATATDGS